MGCHSITFWNIALGEAKSWILTRVGAPSWKLSRPHHDLCIELLGGGSPTPLSQKREVYTTLLTSEVHGERVPFAHFEGSRDGVSELRWGFSAEGGQPP